MKTDGFVDSGTSPPKVTPKMPHLEYCELARYARNTLTNAIVAGKVKRQPCVVCGDPKSQGHHWNYNRPLDVIWLCRPHHREQHRHPHNFQHFADTPPQLGKPSYLPDFRHCDKNCHLNGLTSAASEA